MVQGISQATAKPTTEPQPKRHKRARAEPLWKQRRPVIRDADGQLALQPLCAWDPDWLTDPAASTDSGDSLAIQEDADVEPFMVPANYVLITAAPAMDKASLKRITKFAYKLPEGWETCTFKGFYTGKKAEHQGTCVMHFQVFRQSMYLDLKNNPYGLQESWVALKRV